MLTYLSYLEVLFPLIACGISFAALGLHIVKQTVQRQRLNKIKYQLIDVDDDSSDAVSEDSVAGLTLQKTVSHTNVSIKDVDKPMGEVVLVSIEVLAILGHLGLNIAALWTDFWGQRGPLPAVAQIVTWGYILSLACMRLIRTVSDLTNLPPVWNHTALLYFVQWLLEVVLFRSVLIHPRGGFQRIAAIVGFSLTTVLLLIATSSRKGNKPVELEYEGDIEPSREPLASVFSLFTFSWVDQIVWRGFKQTLEMKDVWNVAVKDKANRQLENFRQIKKTHSLAVRLLLYFKRTLLIQGVWCMFSNLFTFAPTLLLKAILEFLEKPKDTPINAAWLYVILLFFAGAIQAVADGQALWIGRKISIQLRGIIIGEIYSKALRRKAASTAEAEEKKEEKNKDDVEAPKSKRAKLMQLTRRKKKNQKADDSDPENGNVAGNEEQRPIETQANNGTIINLMAIDSFKVCEVSAYLHFLWASVPVQLTLAILLLYRILGLSSIAGIVLMILVLPLNLFIARSFQQAQKKIMACTDARIHATNEVLQNIRIIKYFAWEQRFTDQVNDKRRAELAALRWRYILWSLAATVWSGLPIIITFASFFIYTVIEKKDLVPSVAFPALSMFSLLRVPLDQLADMVAHVQETKVSVDRVDKFLKEEETEKYVQIHEARKICPDPKIALKEASLTWGPKASPLDRKESDAFRLINVNVEFELGGLNIIAGPTGSGKTSLLMALLGEMKLLEGEVFIPGGRSRETLQPDPETGLVEAVAYAAQQAWLVNDTIKENILFASPYDEDRYNEVVQVCSLERDFEILDAGDQTLVGEKGIALSGGQKQRISLARAIYSYCRHLLLDDCLSAVDSHTAKHIFDEAIRGRLMDHRTCILVTHNVTLTVPRADFVVAMENGKIVSQGSPEVVIASGALGDDLLKSRPGSVAPSRTPSNLEEQKAKVANGSADASRKIDDAHAADKSKTQEKANARVESKAEGHVKFDTIKLYLASMGPWYFWIIAGFFFVAVQLGSVATNVWIRQWANSYHTLDTASANSYQIESSPYTASSTYGSNFVIMPQHGSANVIAKSKQDVNVAYYLGVYLVIGAIYVFICFSRELVLFFGSLHASWKLHEQLLEGVMRAKFKFFDSTPLGQLMNRFSKDVEAVDQELAPVAMGMLHSLAAVVTIVILISVITPGFLIAGLFISCIYATVGILYINSSRDLKRMESVQRSPLYQQFGETLAGVVTIRAYGDEARFVRDNFDRVNTHNRPFIYLWATNRWLAFRVDLAGALVSFFAGIFVIRNAGKIDPGAAGLSLSYAITFTENVLWLVRLYAQNEQNMNSVERVKEYIQVEQEAARHIPETQPPANWPSRGSVEFIGYTTRYRSDLDPVLRSVSFKVRPAEKVGIVGRTGAGKSSLALALFRGLEAEQGKILIDDVDIGLIGLQDLREAITIVPQDPTLFTGTLRSNLDPFGIFTDEEIFAALRRVQLISNKTDDDASSSEDTAVQTNPSTPRFGTERSDSTDATLARVVSNIRDENKNIFRNLQSPVAESGTNLSQGQRQLLCLARALLKNPRVLMMDEATASIDYATDAKIQETLRELKQNTLITIAHRLQTIIDYDKVLVLDKGEVVEFDDPYELIKKEGGSFRAMCETSGDFDTLMALAKKSWESKQLIDVE
ncbi:putative atp-dependent bile acid permease [Phaeomoniella chlamydospora]|uniref:Putative atp-dependent bile acid permease n=1 Tax=Phaeomoniella chlamydospora TaxID=158046 RepID=A0A0G2E9K7_PHACM|nr:putative atp-dependent bile acid permease [Phaeomoniella chlamydospora]